MPRGFVGVFLLIGLLGTALFTGVFYWVKFQNQSQANQSKVEALKIQPIPTPTPSLWKDYTNTQYKFQFSYPFQGMLWGKDGYIEGECGNSIVEKDDYQGHHIFLDNLLDIRIVKWAGTIEEYFKNIGAFKQYDLENIDGFRAEEAVKVVGLRKGAEYAVGYPPLVYVSHIYKNDDQIFLLLPFQTPIVNPAGCTNPTILDPVAHSHLKIQDWDISKSFKFY